MSMSSRDRLRYRPLAVRRANFTPCPDDERAPVDPPPPVFLFDFFPCVFDILLS
jgi:hypothetical protein